MSIFSDLLGKHIAAKAIKSNEMAQFCGSPLPNGMILSNPTKFPLTGWKTTTAGKAFLNYLKILKNTLKFIPPRPLRLYPVSRILRVYLP